MIGLLLIAAAGSAALAERGICVGLAWVALAEGETTRVQEGPDFDVHRFTGPGGRAIGAGAARVAFLPQQPSAPEGDPASAPLDPPRQQAI